MQERRERPERRRAGDGMDAGGRATLEQLLNARGKEEPPRFRAFRAPGNRSRVASIPVSMPPPARKVRESGTGFSTGHPALAKRSRHRATAPALPQLRHSCRRHVDSRGAACRHHLITITAQGPRVKQRPSWPALFRRAGAAPEKRVGRCLLYLPSPVPGFLTCCWGIGFFACPCASEPKLSCACGAGLTDLLGRMPNKRQAGCRFLLGTSLLDKQKRSTSPSGRGRKLFAWNAPG
jgi:hypothetical protein